jgi:hypothetical protein
MVMDIKGKTKDNIKARMYITLFYHRKSIEVVYVGSRVAKPKASFVLDKNNQLLVYQWLKSLCFSHGRALNIPRIVNLVDYILYGMKSYDCHVFMQTLIPLAYQDLFPNGICDALMKISHFFRDICFNKLQT